MTTLPERITSAGELDETLSEPSDALVDMMKRLPGDIAILGIAGKMGLTLGRRAVNAVRRAGVAKRVFGVSRFSSPADRERLESWGVETVVCDLLDRDAVSRLPDAANVVFMAGRKFGTAGSEDLTWAMNTLVPGNVAWRYPASRIVAFSTGCVYPFRRAAEGGCTEDDPPAPVGEYAQSCLGRERIFQHAAQARGTPTLLFRLNYAIDLRYGVLHDLAQQIRDGQPVRDTVGFFNAVWQGDANDWALRALELAAAPAAVLNATGPETISVRRAAAEMARHMGMPVRFADAFRDAAYLADAGKLHALMGYPSATLGQMLRWQAEWTRAGGESLGKKTHFDVNDGQY